MISVRNCHLPLDAKKIGERENIGDWHSRLWNVFDQLPHIIRAGLGSRLKFHCLRDVTTCPKFRGLRVTEFFRGTSYFLAKINHASPS